MGHLLNAYPSPKKMGIENDTRNIARGGGYYFRPRYSLLADGDASFGIELSSVAEGSRCSVEALFEEFYKVRNICKGTLGTYLRHCKACRGEEYAGSIKSLCDNPFMWRSIEYAPKLLLE